VCLCSAVPVVREHREKDQELFCRLDCVGVGRKQVCERPELSTVLLGHLQIAERIGISGASLQQAEHNYQEAWGPQSLLGYSGPL
jgi:hypothetical protein